MRPSALAAESVTSHELELSSLQRSSGSGTFLRYLACNVHTARRLLVSALQSGQQLNGACPR